MLVVVVVDLVTSVDALRASSIVAISVATNIFFIQNPFLCDLYAAFYCLKRLCEIDSSKARCQCTYHQSQILFMMHYSKILHAHGCR